MIKKKKMLKAEVMPEFRASIEAMPEDSKIFVDKSLEIAHYIFQLMEHKGMKQKDLALKIGKSEAEMSKMLAGMQNLTLRSLAKLEAALQATIICTPKNMNISFPQGFQKQFLNGVVSKVYHAERMNLKYETKVVNMYSNTGKRKQSEAI